jgi:hypothetical protein
MERGVRTIQPEDSPYPCVTDRVRRTVTFCVGSGVTPRSVYAVNIGTSYAIIAFYNKRGTCEQDQEGQRHDQVDATVVPNVRRQRGAAPASCARLQPRQFPGHAGDAGADQGLVADDLDGQADQDRREGGEPRPLCYLPDGRGRHRTANVPRDFAAHRGTAAAATTSASVRRSMSYIQEQPTERVRPNARENGQIRPSIKRSGYPRCW